MLATLFVFCKQKKKKIETFKAEILLKKIKEVFQIVCFLIDDGEFLDLTLVLLLFVNRCWMPLCATDWLNSLCRTHVALFYTWAEYFVICRMRTIQKTARKVSLQEKFASRKNERKKLPKDTLWRRNRRYPSQNRNQLKQSWFHQCPIKWKLLLLTANL